MILLFALEVGWPSTPSIIGMLGPVISASRRPTLAPDLASATARLTLTVLLPTPPLPDATAMMFLTPGTSCSAARGVARRTEALQVTAMPSTPTAASTRRTSTSISSLSGQAGVVSSIVKATSDPSITRSLTMPRVTRLPPSSGSWTVRRASRTAASEMALIGGVWLLFAAPRRDCDAGGVDILPAPGRERGRRVGRHRPTGASSRGQAAQMCDSDRRQALARAIFATRQPRGLRYRRLDTPAAPDLWFANRRDAT